MPSQKEADLDCNIHSRQGKYYFVTDKNKTKQRKQMPKTSSSLPCPWRSLGTTLLCHEPPLWTGPSQPAHEDGYGNHRRQPQLGREVTPAEK